MSSVTTPKSDLFQTAKAVLIMSLFALIFILIVLVKDNITSFVCNDARLAGICAMLTSTPLSASTDHLVASRINSACVDTHGLKISVAFDAALKGVANIQVFSTGDDYFPSDQGLADSFRANTVIPSETDHLDILIPVDAMPADIQLFGNIIIHSEGSLASHVAYFLQVSGCSTTTVPFPDAKSPTNLADASVTYTATCLSSQRLMISFEFDKPILGQYQALVANAPYHLTSVVNQPAVLYFSGDPPPVGLAVIKLISATDQVVVFDETHTLPACDSK